MADIPQAEDVTEPHVVAEVRLGPPAVPAALLEAGAFVVSFEVRDPKRRLISAAPFRDRVVHHAVCAVIAPLFKHGLRPHVCQPRGQGDAPRRGARRAGASREWNGRLHSLMSGGRG